MLVVDRSGADGDLDALPVLGNRTRAWNAARRRLSCAATTSVCSASISSDRRAAAADALAQATAGAGALDVDADVPRCCRIESGRPVFGKDMTEDTIPLEAGIEDRAISLTKGCYVGQEIIIRVLHRGRAAWRAAWSA